MQLLAKFKKILQITIRAFLNFRKAKVALNPMRRIVLNFAKSCNLSCLSNFDRRKNFTVPFLKYKSLRLQLRVFLAGDAVAMVTHSVMKMITACHSMIGQFFVPCILYQLIKISDNEPSKSTSWIVRETVLSHFNAETDFKPDCLFTRIRRQAD